MRRLGGRERRKVQRARRQGAVLPPRQRAVQTVRRHAAPARPVEGCRMNYPTLCPACLTELPADYPYDHVAIDAALGRRPDLFRRMDRDEKTETVLTGLSRGMSVNRIALWFGWANADLRLLLPADHPVRAEAGNDLEQMVRELWERDLPDSA